ncbi:MAG: hypothetical protein V8S87_01490 [Oscillospiraceae bacterium]
MTEKIIDNHKNGMPVMLALIVAYCAAISVAMIVGGINMDAGGGIALFVVSIVWVCIGWIALSVCMCSSHRKRSCSRCSVSI